MHDNLDMQLWFLINDDILHKETIRISTHKFYMFVRILTFTLLNLVLQIVFPLQIVSKYMMLIGVGMIVLDFTYDIYVSIMCKSVRWPTKLFSTIHHLIVICCVILSYYEYNLYEYSLILVHMFWGCGTFDLIAFMQPVTSLLNNTHAKIPYPMYIKIRYISYLLRAIHCIGMFILKYPYFMNELTMIVLCAMYFNVFVVTLVAIVGIEFAFPSL